MPSLSGGDETWARTAADSRRSAGGQNRRDAVMVDQISNDDREAAAVQGSGRVLFQSGEGRLRVWSSIARLKAAEAHPATAAINLKRLVAAFHSRFPDSGMLRMREMLVSALLARWTGRIRLIPPGGTSAGQNRATQLGNRQGSDYATAAHEHFNTSGDRWLGYFARFARHPLPGRWLPVSLAEHGRRPFAAAGDLRQECLGLFQGSGRPRVTAPSELGGDGAPSAAVPSDPDRSLRKKPGNFGQDGHDRCRIDRPLHGVPSGGRALPAARKVTRSGPS